MLSSCAVLRVKVQRCRVLIENEALMCGTVLLYSGASPLLASN